MDKEGKRTVTTRVDLAQGPHLVKKKCKVEIEHEQET